MASCQITVKKRFIRLPVNPDMRKKNIALYENDTLIYDFDVYYDAITPQFYTYVNLSHLLGKTLTVVTDPETDIIFEFADTLPAKGLYHVPYRPMVHFSTKIGWINDPNGLVYHNGVYHLFYQHNPAGNMWDNMTWGHAVSTDLVHWEEKDDALFPDKSGTMFSGSAITDTENVTGLKSGNTDPLLLFYTAAGNNSKLSKGQPFTQCMAYSLDNGETFTKYENNPVIPHVIGSNRDPKVIYAEELNCYLLALYLDGDRYTIYRSEDLLHFEELQRLSLPGDDECPDLYPLPLETDPTVVKWIFSGASDTYLVGDMTSSGFSACQDVKPYFYGRRTSYAAQTFSGVLNRRIKIAWEVLHAPHQIFENQMGIPCDVSLTTVDDTFRLRTLPVKEFEALRNKTEKHIINCPVFKTTLCDKAFDITLTLPKNSPDFILSFLGHRFTVKVCDNTFSYHNVTLPLSYTGDDLSLRMIVDTLGVEVFLDNGLIYTVKDGLSDYNLNSLALSSCDASSLSAQLTIHTLNGIH